VPHSSSTNSEKTVQVGAAAALTAAVQQLGNDAKEVTASPTATDWVF
jgi:ABC-type molybdate transport system substrate-binding protein